MVLIREAVIDDASAMAEVFLRARRRMLSIAPMVHPDETVLPWIREHLSATTVMWVAEREGRVVALMSLSPGWLEHLYVDPDAQGMWIGSKLLRVAKSGEEGRHGLELWTFAANRDARRFYERHGFVADQFTDGSGNEEKTPDVRYVWRPSSQTGRRIPTP